ncbi:efflux RND transporter permease subunit [Stella sp.]|uniref:efflux RND transporter permease subunit n=1 Tax=Stella sp. TaxID=2912054 RepID=UPI0035B2820A
MISTPFIERPVATILLAIGLFLVGGVAFLFLPVASLPVVDYPTIRVSASRPGADPEIMAATVAAPLERRLGALAGVTEITSSSGVGSTSIVVQFDPGRNIDAAARDIQAAINAAAADLPSDLPSPPSFRKANPAAAPVLILSMTADTVPPSELYDLADNILVQRLSQVEGVAEVTVNGAEQPAIRVRVDPSRLAAMGLGIDQVRQAIAQASVSNPVGSLDGLRQSTIIRTNGQLRTPEQFRRIVVRTEGSTVVRLGDVAIVENGVRNSRSAGWVGARRGILVVIYRQTDANVIRTVDGIKAELPELEQLLPAGVQLAVLSDRTTTIRASVHEMHFTLALSIALVTLVVLLFLRRATPTVAAAVTVPLSLAGTFGLMWVAGYSVNNLTLMALVIAVGFVVDDAIVMIENVYRNLESGMAPMRAAIEGARQIGFTVVSISVSLVAAFVPLIFMPGVVGRLFKEFAMTMTFAIAVSMLVSLTVTPMICGRFLRRVPQRGETWLDRRVEPLLDGLVAGYGRTLGWALRHRILMLLVFFATIAGTAWLYVQLPKGYFPQDDTGLVFAGTRASPDVSFQAMLRLQQRAADIIAADPAVAGFGSFVGGGAQSNTGRMFISLKPLAERGVSSTQVVNRLRPRLSAIPGLQVFMVPQQDLRVGGRSANASYQYTLWTEDLAALKTWAPQVLERLRTVPGVVDVSADREQTGLQVDVSIDREAAARLGVGIDDVGAALNSAFAQRQIAIIYTRRNQYRVIYEVEPRFATDPTSLERLYATAADGTQVPLSAVTVRTTGTAPLSVAHRGQFPSTTISFNIGPEANLEETLAAVDRAVAEMHLPDVIRAGFDGDAGAFSQSAQSQLVLILGAILVIYLVLGILYEDLLHPITILSTLPSAGLGALLSLKLAQMDLSIIALIGIILLVGIVKKNGIMMVDFALEAERRRGLAPADAIREACLERFRPILMTTLAALFGAVPLAIATGIGAELRRPLGVTIVGGLVVSQVLTLYTTPVIYLVLDQLRRRRRYAPQPAE